MSGHSKWATIRHKKGAADAKRGKVFSKLSKELMVCARTGGSDVSMNPTLRTVIQKAKAVNMPADNIDRAIKKGAGELEGVTFEEVMYEAFAAGGVGLVVLALTDNKNRATAEIRHIFTKHGSSFASQGAVSRNFERKGQVFLAADGVDEEKLMEIVLEAGGDDLKREGDQFEIITDPAAFSDVVDALEKEEIKPTRAEVALVSLSDVPVKDPAMVKSIMKFISDLEDSDDVQDVYSNMDVDEEIMKSLDDED